MERPLLTFLLLGFIGFANGSIGQIDRPEFPAHPDLGCVPGKVTTESCPARMECFKNANFPNGGVCDCNPLWFKVPSKLPFDELEWDDGFSTSDCENLGFVRFIVGGGHCITLILSMAFVYTAFVVIREIYRNKALKWNATTTSLIILWYAACGNCIVALIYIANTWDGDKTEFWYTWRTNVFFWCNMPTNFLVDYEIGVTWIDLYDRTNKMSKSTNRKLKILRVVLRLISFFMVCGFPIISFLGGMVSLLVTSMVPNFSGIAFIFFGGNLIVRILCPDRNDVSNPNYKVCEAIRRAIKHGIMAHFTQFIGLLGMSLTRNHPSIGYGYGYFNFLYFFFYIIGKWGWLHYLIYGSRKHLQRFSSDSASSYFGFSTIGLNKTVTRASSVISSKSSAVSTKSGVE